MKIFGVDFLALESTSNFKDNEMEKRVFVYVITR